MKVFLLALAAALGLALTGCGGGQVGGPLPILMTETGGTDIYTEPLLAAFEAERIGADRFVTRTEAAKMLALAFASYSTLEGWAQYPAINFDDVSAETWYFKYINGAVTLRLMESDDRHFSPEKALTYGEAAALLAQINPSGENQPIAAETRETAIPYSVWAAWFLQAVRGNPAISGIETSQIILLERTAQGRWRTDHGAFTAAGMDLQPFWGNEIRVLHREGEIIALLDLVSPAPVLQNAFIMNNDATGVTLLIGGSTHSFTYAAEAAPLPNGTRIADVRIQGSTALGATQTAQAIRGTIEALDTHYITLREWGQMPLDAHFAVYSAAGGHVVQKSPADLLAGSDMADFYRKNGMVVAAVITREITPTTIRVLINTSSFAQRVHESVSVTATGDFTVQGGGAGETTARHFSQGEVFTVRDIADLQGYARLYIAPDDPDSRIEILGLSRNWPGGANPLYRGKMEISAAQGGFIVVNELPLEEYLYAVVPSEMPSSYGLEASMVQAITARSFAHRQFYENRFHAYGAHIDDSVMSQVYNNIPENETSIEAVRATAGLVLTREGQVIVANYFSTSGGTTANSGEVWMANGLFPGETQPHLRARAQFEQGFSPGDLSLEENADAFFRDENVPGFERDFPWFRWQVRMTAEELAASINRSLGQRQNAAPGLIYAVDANGKPIPGAVSSIGHLRGLAVTRRGQGGNIMEMLLYGTNATVRVQTEFNIRTLLAPRNSPITRANASTVNGMGMMPSAFFTMEPEVDVFGNLIAVTFYGGGHGHGVGMSQNGVKALLDKGVPYREVLAHFYPGAVIEQK